MQTQTQPKTRRMAFRAVGVAAGLLPLLFASACTVVGPDYQRPAVTVPDTFRGGPGAPGAAPEHSVADQPWREVFVDPALQTLIDQGLANNHDMAIAVARFAHHGDVRFCVEDDGEAGPDERLVVDHQHPQRAGRLSHGLLPYRRSGAG